jgi:hypothetical protein
MGKRSQKTELTKRLILEEFVKFVKKNKRYPTEVDLKSIGITRNAVLWHYGTVKDLRTVARKKYPSIFKNFIDDSIFTHKNFNNLKKLVSKHKRIIVTTVVAGAAVHKDFYAALKHYAEDKNALLTFIPVKDPASKGNSPDSWNLDPIIGAEQIIFGDIALNDNLYISGIKISAKQINPVKGLSRLSHSCSFIYGSPKIMLKAHANSNHKMPHLSLSTGAITIPNYETDKFMSMRTAYLAEFDHKLGAIVIELDKDNKFFFRHIQAEPKTGNFVDLTEYYTPRGKRKQPMLAEAFSRGDTHIGEEDPECMKVWDEIANVVKPRLTIDHDTFNGKSVNPHIRKNIVARALLSKTGLLSLEHELKITAAYLNEVHKTAREGTIMVPSNHNDWIRRYLEDGEFKNDETNFFMAVELLNAIRDGKDPIQFGIEKFMNEEAKKRTNWLQRDNDFRIAGIELGVHGDLGANGKRNPTLQSLGECYGAGVFGHSHTPGIFRDAWQNGTSTFRQLDYNRGASSWMQSSTIVYPNGARQMIYNIKGKWRL